MSKAGLILLLVAASAGIGGAATSAEGDIAVLAAPKALAAGAVSEDWACFLGPRHNSTSTETHLLKAWPKTGPTLLWSLVKGMGYASPAIRGDALVYAHRIGDEDVVECLHPETGARRWQFRSATAYQDRYGYNNGPRSSPVIAGDAVYVRSQEGVLRCLALADGTVRWTRPLSQEFKVPQDFFGIASTPLVQEGLVIINLGAPGGPGVLAVDAATGVNRWTCDDQWGPSYASPIPAIIHGKPRVLVFAGGESRPPTGGLLCIDPANGKLDFRFPWRSRSYESVNASCPVAIGDQVFISASYQTGGALLSIAEDFSFKVAWTSEEFGLHFNTAIARDGYLYACHGRNEPDAELACIEAATGKVQWKETPQWKENFKGREATFGVFRGNLLWADGNFLCLGEFGHLLWLDLSPKGYKEVARAWLFAANETWSPPIISHGLLYICQNTKASGGEPPRLLCYDLRGE